MKSSRRSRALVSAAVLLALTGSATALTSAPAALHATPTAPLTELPSSSTTSASLSTTTEPFATTASSAMTTTMTAQPTVNATTMPTLVDDSPIPIVRSNAPAATPEVLGLRESTDPTTASDLRATDLDAAAAVVTPAPVTRNPRSVDKYRSTKLRSTASSGSSSDDTGKRKKNDAKHTKKPKPKETSDEGDDDVSSDGDDNSEGSDDSEKLDPELSFACMCKSVRKVSLMGASDYCLGPGAAVGNKCGNTALGTKGECPPAKAQPCQDTGHVLTNNSICAFDKRDETYKCVASKEDLLIQKRGGKRRKRSSLNSSGDPKKMSAATPRTRATAFSLGSALTVAASLLVGIAALA